MKTYVIDIDKIGRLLAHEFPEWKGSNCWSGFSNGVLDGLATYGYQIEDDIADAVRREFETQDSIKQKLEKGFTQ